ncbi:hypothetical protein ANN_15696 [Periplaneta americana]|uniref:Uncharacterized protein n=1 Tax=Periplaneta americana TaxID=6978 RepID=A0ABQ8SHG6_PERAM|nr:hypothetical protein ANN_15696 [Periplaneta americana]
MAGLCEGDNEPPGSLKAITMTIRYDVIPERLSGDKCTLSGYLAYRFYALRIDRFSPDNSVMRKRGSNRSSGESSEVEIRAKVSGERLFFLQKYSQMPQLFVFCSTCGRGHWAEGQQFKGNKTECDCYRCANSNTPMLR